MDGCFWMQLSYNLVSFNCSRERHAKSREHYEW